MPQLFTNNARSTLTSTINDSATALTVQSGAADLFPVANTGAGSIPTTSDWFKATLQDVSGNVEIIYVRTRTAGSAVFSNILRGREGTTAREFVAGSIVGLRLTAADIQASINIKSEDNTFVGDNEFVGATEFSGAAEFSGGATFSDTATFNAEVDFTDDTTCATQDLADDSTKLANTEFVQAIKQSLHPVGSIYINAVDATNPATLFGFGTWSAFGAGRVLVGFDASDTSFNSAEEIGGSKDAIVVAHTHTATVTDPGHDHKEGPNGGSGHSTGSTGNYLSYLGLSDGGQRTGTATTGITVDNSTTGSSGTNANLQPYITVYMWKRTA
jgi:hypothetical protein